ncbi:PhoU domain-containing protein [Mycoplasma sp. ATU-Cv-703]|uniref:PhoU domain-containing protein n=1 Tax=Mycoplasma sp. ATU-Cv-703 TaxID=2498595 RepID=UPI000FDF1212
MATSIIRIETRKIQEKLIKMFILVLNQHSQMARALENDDKDAAQKIINDDRQVNALFDEIHGDLEFLITKTPLDKDLRRTMAYIMIAQDIERIGDYVKSIGRFIIKAKPLKQNLLATISKVHQPFLRMIKKLSEVISRESFDLAVELVKRDLAIEKLANDMRMSLISSITSYRKQEQVMAVIFATNVIGAIERATNYVVHICELIAYVHTGKNVDLT